MNIFECIPRDLKAIPRWVIWKFTQRPDGSMGKIPQGPNGNASAHDPKNWLSFEDAVKALQQRLASARWPQGGGIGFVFTDDDDIGGVDLDGCRDPETGKIAAWAKRVIDVFDGAYVEASPSGTGFHIITRGAPSSLARTERSIDVAEGDLTSEGKGAVLEAYVTKRFFTMTGDHLTGRLELAVRREAWAQVDAFLRGEQSRQDREEQARNEGREPEPLGDADMDDVRAALGAFGSDAVDRNTWVAIGMALKAEFGEEGRAIWKEWMGRSAHDDADANDKTWEGLPGRPHSVGLGTIFWYAKQHGWKPARRKGGGDASDGVAAVLAGIIDGVELWHDQRRKPYATVDVDGRHQNLPIGDKGDFATWLMREYYHASGATPRREKLKEAIGLAQARALFDGRQHSTWIRTATAEDGTIYIDIGDETWRAIEIDGDGWQIVDVPPVKFRRSGGGQALRLPVKGNAAAAISRLGELVQPRQREHLMLIIAFMVACFRAGYPIPILVLDCEPGSAKSSTLRALVSLIDPHVLPTPGLPDSERDVVVTAHNRWLVPADNVASITRSMSDVFCRLITGGGTVGRALYTDEGENSTPVKRPVIMTVLDSPTLQGDFIERSISIPLAEIEQANRLPEMAVEKRLAELQPIIMGALLEGVSAAIRRLDRMAEMHAGKLPRMADFALWAEAAGEAFGWQDGEFLEAYSAMLESRAVESAADDGLSHLIQVWMEKQQDGAWEGTAGELLKELDLCRSFGDMASGNWFPTSARALSGRLKERRRALKALGIIYTNRQHPHSKTQGRLHCLEQKRSQATEGTEGRTPVPSLRSEEE